MKWLTPEKSGTSSGPRMEPPSPRQSKLLILILLGGIAIGGFLICWYSTKLGVGMANDSQDYVSTARSIVAGRGVRVFNPTAAVGAQWVPLPVFPPMYPEML